MWLNMKKLITSFLLIAVLSLIGAIFLIDYKAPVKEKIFKECIYLKNGDMIIADSSSKGGKLLYYKKGNTTNFILQKNIKNIEKIEMEESASDKRIKIFREHVKKIKSFTPDLFKPALYYYFVELFVNAKNCIFKKDIALFYLVPKREYNIFLKKWPTLVKSHSEFF